MLSCIFCVSGNTEWSCTEQEPEGSRAFRRLGLGSSVAWNDGDELSRTAGPALLRQPSGDPTPPAQPSPVARVWPQTLKEGGILVPARRTDRQTKTRGKGHPHLTASTSPHGRSKIPGRLVCRLGAFFQGACVSRQNSITVQEGENRNWGKLVPTTAPTFTIFTYSCLKGAKMSFILYTGSFIQDHPWA